LFRGCVSRSRPVPKRRVRRDPSSASTLDLAHQFDVAQRKRSATKMRIKGNIFQQPKTPGRSTTGPSKAGG